ncbi:hypothetical protein [Streptomyces sp. NRRL F-5123]|uniref:hypothetical protein n=1 Tax=Streptomyces sp. NRRL F-5123 TaxID=1463856 RepID=UPI000694C09F|nr:hypothetical protein [Streptomyces sp. NRRL F-5123]
MTLIALLSLKGSPGVTTTALGLAVCWPSGEQPVVVECDAAGGDLLARFRLELSPSLMSLAAAARHGADAGLLWQHTQRLPGGLPVVVGPAGGDQARAALAQLNAGVGEVDVLRQAADRAGTVVIADCGRFSGDEAVMRIVRAADAVLLLAHARDDALSHLATLLARPPSWLRDPLFVLAGDGYPTPEVAEALNVTVLGRLPDDPRGAAALAGRPARRPAPAKSPLLRALAPITASVAHRAAACPRHRSRSAAGAVSDPRTVWGGASR